MLRPPLDPPTARPAALSLWLNIVAALIVAMVVIGGITRLTESGLSITEWKPISGIIPPLNAAQWAAEFDAYKRIPEYTQLNAGMTLAEFKSIFFWEYTHRLLGRVIGLAFGLPLLWFAVTKRIPRGYGPRLVALLALGGFQGAIGWWMVTSGLSVRTDVSHVRLTVHLITALIILGGTIWTALDLSALARSSDAAPARMSPLGIIVLLIVLVQLAWGALMAGLNAGLVARDWPLMNGQLYPGVSSVEHGFPGAIINDPAIVHFIHRWWAWVVVAALVLLARVVKRAGQRRESILIHSAFGTQVILGIGTVMMGVPIWLAALHQLVGALVLVTTVRGVHAIGVRASPR